MNGPVKGFKVTPVLGLSTHNAVVDAEAWLMEVEEEPDEQWLFQPIGNHTINKTDRH